MLGATSRCLISASRKDWKFARDSECQNLMVFLLFEKNLEGGPFLGAWIGEKYAGQNSDQALRAAAGSFIGFLAGTLMKIAVSVILAFYFFRAVWQAVF